MLKWFKKKEVKTEVKRGKLVLRIDQEHDSHLVCRKLTFKDKTIHEIRLDKEYVEEYEESGTVSFPIEFDTYDLIYLPQSGDAQIIDSKGSIGREYTVNFDFNEISDGISIVQSQYGKLECTKVEFPLEVDGITVTTLMGPIQMNINEVTINENIRSIRPASMANCGIKAINFDDRLSSLNIGAHSFKQNNLRKVDLPQQTSFIGANAFAMNNIRNLNLKKINATVVKDAFRANSITNVNISGANIEYNSNFLGQQAVGWTKGTVKVREDQYEWASENISLLDGQPTGWEIKV